jgi:hypothetical protein
MGTTLLELAFPRKAISEFVPISILAVMLSHLLPFRQYLLNSMNSYVDGAIYQLKRYAESHGKAGTDELNTVCPTHTVTLSASTAFSYCGSTISDSKLNIVFNPNCLGTNVNDALYEVAKVISEAPQPEGAPKLSFAARHAVATDYDPAIGDLLEKARAALQNPKLEFEPDFDGLGKMLKGSKDVRDDWERNLGSFAVKYYESFVDTLVSEKFGEDEMLREGFEEGVPKGVVKLRIVEKMSGYNAILVEDGVLILQVC